MITWLISLQLYRLFDFGMHDAVMRNSKLSRKFIFYFCVPIIVFACVYVGYFSLNSHSLNLRPRFSHVVSAFVVVDMILLFNVEIR